MPSPGIYIVTHKGLPKGAPDDRLLAEEIVRKGGRAQIVAWDAAEADWPQSGKLVIRSAWNYHLNVSAWYNWIDIVSAQCAVVNSPALLRWNADKRYLLELQQKQIPVVPTVLLDAVANADIESWLLGYGDDIIVKPSVGASAAGVKRFKLPTELKQCILHLKQLNQFCDALVQPFQAAVEHDRERSLVYIAGAFTHAFTKPAFHPGISAGSHVEMLMQPSIEERGLGERVLNSLPVMPAYARVDLVPTANGPLLMELELIEPHLAFHLSPKCCEFLADELLVERDHIGQL